MLCEIFIVIQSIIDFQLCYLLFFFVHLWQLSLAQASRLTVLVLDLKITALNCECYNVMLSVLLNTSPQQEREALSTCVDLLIFASTKVTNSSNEGIKTADGSNKDPIASVSSRRDSTGGISKEIKFGTATETTKVRCAYKTRYVFRICRSANY